eukprot:CAMPEP_0183486936 /NCGR_PEP_ID=MMETSP0370-20130417/180186_1 /TAXON_ID=268820 /ORGANISM="Peridinium aciculiferum, Strain PAER-2" /LENGTH=462 /DNA_ID=CAMNT_0025680255 /DNA_START=63 /DNA_END=1451 /DNA_ORIENTATION=+
MTFAEIAPAMIRGSAPTLASTYRSKQRVWQGSVATTELAIPGRSPTPTSSTALAGTAAASIAAAAAVSSRGRAAARARRAKVAARAELKETKAALKEPEAAPRREGMDLMTLAKEAGINLEVKPWEFLTSMAQDAARGWFVKRAEDRGIPWSESVQSFEDRQGELDSNYADLCDPSIEYPDYYLQPFHGYDSGNLEWHAAHELEAATQSMCLGYYSGPSWQDSQEMFRGAARATIAEMWSSSHGAGPEDTSVKPPRTLLDIGCSGGFSTEEMAKTFPGVSATGLDLSPHYLSVAKLTYPQFHFMHGLAENTGLPSGSFDVVTFNFILHELPLAASLAAFREAHRLLAPGGENTGLPSGSFDVVTFNFILHELPLAVSLAAFREAHRLLAPGGIVAVLDIDPRRLLELPPLRRWAFQVTEPWCKDGEYYSLNFKKALEEVGFDSVKTTSNDPVNAVVVARKSK